MRKKKAVKAAVKIIAVAMAVVAVAAIYRAKR